MEKFVKVNDSSSVIHQLRNNEGKTPFTLGLYLDMNPATQSILALQLSTITIKYSKLTVFYCTSSNRYVDTNDGQHELPYYELYGYNEKIATRTAKGRLEQSELKAFLDAHILH